MVVNDLKFTVFVDESLRLPSEFFSQFSHHIRSCRKHNQELERLFHYEDISVAIRKYL